MCQRGFDHDGGRFRILRSLSLYCHHRYDIMNQHMELYINNFAQFPRDRSHYVKHRKNRWKEEMKEVFEVTDFSDILTIE